jgi:hypothetical protein
MPREAAAVRLTALIEALSDEPASANPSKASAAALVALLPKGKGPEVRPSDSMLAATGFRRTQILLALSAFAIMMLIAFTMSALFSAGIWNRRETAGGSRR